MIWETKGKTSYIDHSQTLHWREPLGTSFFFNFIVWILRCGLYNIQLRRKSVDDIGSKDPHYETCRDTTSIIE